MKPFSLAIVGATGLVGQAFLEILEKKAWPIESIVLFASSRSVGKEVLFKGEKQSVRTINKGCFLEVDYALFSINGQLSKVIAKQAVSEGCVVIDNSSAFRFDDAVPLVVPSVNGDLALKQSLIANPNCSTIQAVIPLAVLATLSPIESIAYHTYQSVSGSGHKGVLALTRKLDYYPVDITQTVLPHIDSMMGDGYTFEEVKMINETKKILNDPTLRISATCVRVPIERGHGVSVSVVTKEHVSLEAFKKALKKQPMVELKNVPSTIDVARLNKIQVGRLRKDYSHANGLLFYVAADNLYVGAAANAIDILERVIR